MKGVTFMDYYELQILHDRLLGRYIDTLTKVRDELDAQSREYDIDSWDDVDQVDDISDHDLEVMDKVTMLLWDATGDINNAVNNLRKLKIYIEKTVV